MYIENVRDIIKYNPVVIAYEDRTRQSIWAIERELLVGKTFKSPHKIHFVLTNVGARYANYVNTFGSYKILGFEGGSFPYALIIDENDYVYAGCRKFYSIEQAISHWKRRSSEPYCFDNGRLKRRANKFVKILEKYKKELDKNN